MRPFPREPDGTRRRQPEGRRPTMVRVNADLSIMSVFFRQDLLDDSGSYEGRPLPQPHHKARPCRTDSGNNPAMLELGISGFSRSRE